MSSVNGILRIAIYSSAAVVVAASLLTMWNREMQIASYDGLPFDCCEGVTHCISCGQYGAQQLSAYDYSCSACGARFTCQYANGKYVKLPR